MGKINDFITAITIFISALILDYLLYPILDSFGSMFNDTVTKGIYYAGMMGIMILATAVIPMMYILKPIENKSQG